MKLVEIEDQEAWDAFVDGSAWGHPLQLWGWGETKRPGWVPVRLALMDGEQWQGAVQVLLWRIPKLGRVIAYAPRGPVVEPGTAAAAELLRGLVAWARERQALYVRVEPAWREAHWPKGWRRARDEVQMAQTYTIDLTETEEQILQRMTRKHRYYIRWTEQHGVTVEREIGGNLGPFYEIYQQTAKRAGFGIHELEYYERLFQELGDHNYLYYAKVEHKPVAFVWLAAAGTVACELYAGMNEQGAEMNANYALKWRGFTDMKAAGRTLYDMNGRLTGGVTDFKAKFGPDETNWVGTWDRPLQPALYSLWQRAWPMVKPVGRWLVTRGRSGR